MKDLPSFFFLQNKPIIIYWFSQPKTISISFYEYKTCVGRTLSF